jgi:hypothetical protein
VSAALAESGDSTNTLLAFYACAASSKAGGEKIVARGPKDLGKSKLSVNFTLRLDSARLIIN